MFQPEGKLLMNYRANKGVSYIKEHRVMYRNSDWQNCVFPIRYWKWEGSLIEWSKIFFLNLFILKLLQSYWRQMNEIVCHRKVWSPSEVGFKEVWLVEQRKEQFGEIWKTDKKEKIPSKLEVAPYALKMSTGWMEWSGWYPLDCYDY